MAAFVFDVIFGAFNGIIYLVIVTFISDFGCFRPPYLVHGDGDHVHVFVQSMLLVRGGSCSFSLHFWESTPAWCCSLRVLAWAQWLVTWGHVVPVGWQTGTVSLASLSSVASKKDAGGHVLYWSSSGVLWIPVASRRSWQRAVNAAVRGLCRSNTDHILVDDTANLIGPVRLRELMS